MAEHEKLFRFQDMEVWQRAADLGFNIDSVADVLERHHRYRFAEQMRAAALSISNNFAEGSGSISRAEFRQFLNFARRSAFECANMILLVQRQPLMAGRDVRPILIELHEVSRMITGFSRSLR